MKKLALILAVVMIASASWAHLPVDVVFPAVHFPDANVPTIDGNLGDWDVIPEGYWINHEQLTETVRGVGTAWDATDLSLRAIVGYNPNTNLLYVMEDRLNDPKFGNRMARFLRASKRGWEYAGWYPDRAAAIVLENDDTGAQTEKHQRRMMREINRLVSVGEQSNGIGFLEPADYNRTVKVLLASDSDPVITKEPKGAWTHKVYEAMSNL